MAIGNAVTRAIDPGHCNSSREGVSKMSHIIAIAVAVAIGLLGVGAVSHHPPAAGTVAPMDAIPPTGLTVAPMDSIPPTGLTVAPMDSIPPTGL